MSEEAEEMRKDGQEGKNLLMRGENHMKAPGQFGPQQLSSLHTRCGDRRACQPQVLFVLTDQLPTNTDDVIYWSI